MGSQANTDHPTTGFHELDGTLAPNRGRPNREVRYSREHSSRGPSMPRVPLAPSPIHGIGVFAVDPLPKGAEVWRLTPGLDEAGMGSTGTTFVER
jgi:hypothetical protein